jgi:hypothetical protein
VFSSGNGNEWIEPVLRSSLKRVAAPAELWDRVVLPQPPKRRPFRQRIWWALSMASAVVASLAVVASAHYPGRTTAQASARAAEFSSDQPSNIRTWIRSQTGLDVPLPGQLPSAVRIRGARISAAGGVEIHFSADGQDAVLMISAAHSPLPDHRELDSDFIRTATAFAWSMEHQEYTLAVRQAGTLRSACQVCHTDLTL